MPKDNEWLHMEWMGIDVHEYAMNGGLGYIVGVSWVDGS